MMQAISGRCLCGAIHYRADALPVFSGNCHCRDCQRSSGSGYVPAMLFAEAAVSISGTPRFYSSTADNGQQHARGFCPECGSQLFARFSAHPGLIGIKAGTLDDSTRYQPQLDFFTQSAATWDVMDPALPKKPGAAQG